jgi:hypothetical protein
MSHLTSDRIAQIENNLLQVKSFKDNVIATWINIFLFVVIVGGSIYGLYVNYNKPPKKENVNIDFNPQLWNNAVKNMPIINYGQVPQTETGDDIQGFTNRSNATSF